MGYYGNALRQLVDNPGNYESSPGYRARLDKSLEAVKRAGSSMLGSGNYLTALMDAARGGVADDYDREFGRRAHLAEDEQTSDLAGGRLDLDREMGRGNLGLSYYRAGNEFDLGERAADTADNRAWYDYSLGRDRNNIAATDSRNRYSLDSARVPLDWYNARTNRGSARSDDWLRADQSAREWRKLNPPRNVF